MFLHPPLCNWSSIDKCAPSFTVASRCSNNHVHAQTILCPRITHCFLWRVSLFFYFVHISMTPYMSVMSAFSLHVSSLFTVDLDASSSCHGLTAFTAFLSLCPERRFCFVSWVHTEYAVKSAHEQTKSFEVHSRPGSVGIGEVPPSLRVWCHFGLGLPFGEGCSLWKVCLGFFVCVKTKGATGEKAVWERKKEMEKAEEKFGHHGLGFMFNRGVIISGEKGGGDWVTSSPTDMIDVFNNLRLLF